MICIMYFTFNVEEGKWLLQRFVENIIFCLLNSNVSNNGLLKKISKLPEPYNYSKYYLNIKKQNFLY